MDIHPIFDFIIVGAGSAGCLLAEKLSRSGQFSVGLIEAGTTDQYDAVQQHDQWLHVVQQPELGWNLKTTPQLECSGRILEPEVGKLLGGCSSHNAQCHVRCNNNDWDAWEKEGCTGWNRKTMLKAFKNFEKAEIETEYHGSSGSLEIRPPLSDPFTESIKHAAQEANIPWYDDLNAEKQLGIGYVWANVFADYKRCGSYQAFVAPHLSSRKNLTLISGAQASRVIFEGTTAVGVEYVTNQNKDKTVQVMAKWEVILSCGGLLSPHLLMLSGVGPKQHLEEHNIPVVLDLPGVGQNLSDHMYANMYFKAKKELPSKKEWASVQAFGRIDGKYDDDSLTPDFQYIICGRKEWLPGLTYPPGTQENSPHVFASLALLHPKSRGTVTLSSNNPLQNPIVNPNYFQYEEEIQTFHHAANHLRNLTTFTSEWIETEIIPGKNGLEEELKFWRDNAKSMWHPVGTCRMGSETDPRSVVNPKLKVIQTQHLRVIDASVMPSVPSGNTHAPTLAVADRGAEMILEDILVQVN